MSHETSQETSAELRHRVDQAWNELQRTVASLTPRELTEVRDPAGWAVKDHLIHIAAWEQAFLAGLDGRPRHEALGIDPADDRGDDFDAINAAIFARHRDRSLGDVQAAVEVSHREVRARLAGPAARRPAPGDVAGNTWEHYREHHGWIRELVGRPAA
jgi:hypothetical protein